MKTIFSVPAAALLMTGSLLALPAVAEDTDPNGLTLNDDNQDRDLTDDLIDDGADEQYRYFRSSDGRRFRMPVMTGDVDVSGAARGDIDGDTDPNGLVLNDDNQERMNSGDLKN